jgi:hypothetical protein
MSEPDYLKRADAKGHLKVMAMLRKWDPIGVISSGNQDEYDSYSPQIVRLLDHGCTAEELAAHLDQLVTDQMRLIVDHKRDLEIAKELVLWWKDWKTIGSDRDEE